MGKRAGTDQTLQNQQSDAISPMAANISALESSKNALCACWMLKIPPVFSGCYIYLCFNVLKLSHVLKKITVFVFRPALQIESTCIVNSLEMPQILLDEGVRQIQGSCPVSGGWGCTQRRALLFICYTSPKSLAFFAVKGCGEAAVGGRFSIAPSLTHPCLEFNVCW